MSHSWAITRSVTCFGAGYLGSSLTWCTGSLQSLENGWDEVVILFLTNVVLLDTADRTPMAGTYISLSNRELTYLLELGP